jgi:hypothetical protein
VKRADEPGIGTDAGESADPGVDIVGTLGRELWLLPPKSDGKEFERQVGVGIWAVLLVWDRAARFAGRGG